MSGWITDFDCEEGETPWGGHGLEEEEPKDECDYVGDRSLEGENIAFTMTRKMSSATLKGRLVAYGGGHGGHETADAGGEVVGRPMVDMVWTAAGGTYASRYTTTYREGTTTWTETWRSTDRDAVVEGILGPMGFDPDFSSGYMTAYRTSSKSRTK